MATKDIGRLKHGCALLFHELDLGEKTLATFSTMLKVAELRINWVVFLVVSMVVELHTDWEAVQVRAGPHIDWWVIRVRVGHRKDWAVIQVRVGGRNTQVPWYFLW